MTFKVYLTSLKPAKNSQTTDTEVVSSQYLPGTVLIPGKHGELNKQSNCPHSDASLVAFP